MVAGRRFPENDRDGVVQHFIGSYGYLARLLLMTAADRRMSRSDLDQARENFERLETQTAKRVLEFYNARRNERTIVSPPIVPEASANSGADMPDSPTQPMQQAS